MMAPSQATTASPSGELDLMVLALWPKKCALRAHTARLMAVVFLCTLCVVLGKSNRTFTAKQGVWRDLRRILLQLSPALFGDPRGC